MVIRLVILLAFIAFPCFAGETDFPTPTKEQIETWWKPENKEKPDEEFHISDMKPVRLKSGEKAFVASVWFPTRGHCCDYGIMLIRPALQEAKLTEDGVQVERVMDIGSHGFDEVVIDRLCLEHGYLTGLKIILYFDGWNPVVVHSAEYEDNSGYGCGGDSGRPCHSVSVEWTFSDLQGDGKLCLVERIQYDDDEEDGESAWVTKISVYKFVDLKFVIVPPNQLRPEATEPEPQQKTVDEKSTSVPSDKGRVIDAQDPGEPANQQAPQPKDDEGATKK